MKRKYIYLLVLLFLGVIWFYYSFRLENTEPKQETEPKQPTIEYGIVTDSFEVIHGVIEPNQVLGTLLNKYNISTAIVDKLAHNAKEIFDFTKIKAGQPYTVFCAKDANGLAKCFVYEESPTDYVVIDFQDSISVYKGQKPMQVKRKVAFGTINSSLWETMEEHHLDPSLIMRVADIYAWTIDFFRIQKGDKFRLYYEEKFVEGKSVGIGRIWAVKFTHSSEDFYAFYFQDDFLPLGDYFDENGKTLRKAFLKAPLNFSRISSGYSLNRRHPVTGIVKAHLGTDYAAPSGTPILTTSNGTVIEARYSRFNGNYVKVKHNNTYTTQYLHMSKIGKGIRAGVHVKQGDVIGYVGSTGLATGPHVCYRFWKNGKQVDPLKEILPAAEPIRKESKEAYKLAKDSLILYLAEPTT